MVGLGLTAAAVTFFVATNARASTLATSGERTTATVLRSVPARSWDIFDSGHLVVRYQVAGTTYERDVWLDDPAHAQAPQTTVTVLYDRAHPDRIRTVDDTNDPVPWGVPMVLCGLVGIVVLGRSLYVLVLILRLRRYRRRRGLSSDDPLFGAVLPSDVAPMPTDGRPAWEADRTRQAWRRSARRVALTGAVTGLLAVASLAIHLGVRASDERWRDGATTTPGTVIDGGAGDTFGQSWVEIRYRVNGVVLDATVSGTTVEDHPVGTGLAVLYHPDRPDRIRTTDAANHSDLTQLALIGPPCVSALGLLNTIVGATRLLRWRRELRRRPWQVWEGLAGGLTTTLWPPDARWIRLATTTADGSPVAVTLRLGSGLRWSEATSWTPEGQQVWYLPGPYRRGIIQPSDCAVPLSVYLPGSTRQLRTVTRRRGQ